MPQNFVPSFVEVWMQAAQVINQQNALRQKAEADEERLALREKYQEELALNRQKNLQLREDNLALQEQKHADQLTRDAEKQKQEWAKIEIARTRSKRVGVDSAALERNRELRNEKLARENLTAEVESLEEDLDRKLIGKPTGNPEIDELAIVTKEGTATRRSGILDLDRKALNKYWADLNDDLRRQSGPLITILAAQHPELDPTAAAELQLARLETYMDWRTERRGEFLDEISKSAAPESPRYRAAGVLAGESYRLDAMTPRPGEAKRAQTDQAAANATGGPLPNAMTGTTGSGGPPPSPWLEDVYRTLDGYSNDMLSKPEGNTAAASYLSQKYLEATSKGNIVEADAIYAKTIARNKALAKKLEDLVRASKKKK